MIKKLLSITLLLLAACSGGAQQRLPKGAVPFEYQSNHIYVRGLLQGDIPVRLAFDTGAKYLILDKD